MDYSAIFQKYAPLRENLLLILHEVQASEPYNYVPPAAVKSIADYLNITLAAVYGVIGYYSMLSAEPRGRHIIRVCTSPVCRMNGSFDLLQALQAQLGLAFGQRSRDGLFSLESSECLGNCHFPPSLMVDEKLYSAVNSQGLAAIIDRVRTREEAAHG